MGAASVDDQGAAGKPGHSTARDVPSGSQPDAAAEPEMTLR